MFAKIGTDHSNFEYKLGGITNPTQAVHPTLPQTFKLS
jgi:hypothetical protein